MYDREYDTNPDPVIGGSYYFMEKEFDILSIDAVVGFTKFAPVLKSLNHGVPKRVTSFRPFYNQSRNTNFVLQQFVGKIPGITFASPFTVREMEKEPIPASPRQTEEINVEDFEMSSGSDE